MKKWISLLLSLAIVLTLCSCGSSDTGTGTGKPFHILALKGPTGMGFSKMINDNMDTEREDAYIFDIISDPSMVTSSLATGKDNIASCPLNMAALLYRRTGGNMRILAVNTLGTLYVLDRTGNVKSIEDLEGKTIVTSGKGAVPEYVLSFLLDNAGLKDKVTVEYKNEHSEVAAAILSGKADVVMLPEPNVTVVMSKDNSIKAAVDVSKKIKEITGTDLAMGCIIASSKFVEDNTANGGIKRFLEKYKKSVDYINSSKDAGQLIASAKIVDNPEIAQKAIPGSSIVYIDGDEMINIANANFKMLYDCNPASIGGKLPDENIFYVAEK